VPNVPDEYKEEDWDWITWMVMVTLIRNF
jgi:hypothetical protein